MIISNWQNSLVSMLNHIRIFQLFKVLHIILHHVHISRVSYVKYLLPARYACQNGFFSLFLSINLCWIQKMQVPFFPKTPSSSILNFKMAAIFIIFLMISTCSCLHYSCLALHIHEFCIKIRHKVILCVILYQPKINNQLKFKMAAKWALCKV